MIIMPANNSSAVVRGLAKEYPESIGILNTPFSWKKPFCKYALDNGCFTKFDEKKYFTMLGRAKNYKEPMFVTVPDVIGCHDRTLILWHYYYPKIKPYNYPIAFVAQDGCTPETVPGEADWIFIGGLDPWKKDNIHKFIGDKPVHVGRVNSLWFLEYCESLGVASVDGTGWMRARGRQYFDFIEWFEGNHQIGLWT